MNIWTIKKSNKNLQNAFNKYGLDKFYWVIYEYFSYENKIISEKSLTDLETSYIKAFDFTAAAAAAAAKLAS